jgi:hypothetical protein
VFRRIIVPSLFLAVLANCSAAHAVITEVFTTQTDWETAVNGTFTQENFNDPPEINPIPNNTSTPVGSGISVFYTTTDMTDNPAITRNVAGDALLSLRWDTLGANQTSVLRLDFDSPIGSFAANFRSVDDGDGLTLSINGDVRNIADLLADDPMDPLADDNGFLGFISNTSFTSIEFGGSGDTLFRLGSAFTSPVPEPAVVLSMLTLGVCGLCVVGLRRRNRK